MFGGEEAFIEGTSRLFLLVHVFNILILLLYHFHHMDVNMAGADE